MEYLRTPDERFSALAGFGFTPRYADIPAGDGTTLRMHYVDEGPPDALPIVCLHGEPTWSYLYRDLIPIFAAAGHRVLAPDLIGFGRSDKPTDAAVYTYERHVAWLRAWFRALDLKGITLVAHDWGGWLGLRVVTAEGERFARVAVSNTGLPTCDEPMNETAKLWFEMAVGARPFPIAAVLPLGTTKEVQADVLAGYDAPYPEESYKTGPQQFPVIAPKCPDDPGVAENRAAWHLLERWTKPFLTVFGDNDPLNEGNDRVFQARIPGAASQPHATIRGAGHYIQEDRGAEMANVILEWVRATADRSR